MLRADKLPIASFVLMFLVCAVSLAISAAPAQAQTQLGTIGKSLIQFTVTYNGSTQPGGYITFTFLLSYYGQGAWLNERVPSIQIWSDFGNSTVPGSYPAYFTQNNTVRTLTMLIPSNIAQGNHRVTAVASLQVVSINIVYGNQWYNEQPLSVVGSIPIQTTFGGAISTTLTTIAKYWAPLLLTYLTAVVLAVFLVAKSERKKQEALRVPLGAERGSW